MNSFLKIIEVLFCSAEENENIYILSERFSKDSLKNYFGTLRTKGGRNTNPSAKEALDASASIRIQGTVAQDPIRGNSSRRKRLFNNTIDSACAPVPKRS